MMAFSVMRFIITILNVGSHNPYINTAKCNIHVLDVRNDWLLTLILPIALKRFPSLVRQLPLGILMTNQVR